MNAAEERLVKALRSGSYKQIQGALRTDNGFCCLGVACDLYGPQYWEKSPDSVFTHNKNGGILSGPVRQELNWRTYSGVLRLSSRHSDCLSLAGLNDSGFTFNQIADIIQAGLIVKEGEDFHV